MSSYKEIVTKAVIGKAKKVSSNEFILTPEENPDTVLGCWVINHTFNGLNNMGSVLIKGSFDVNVWYSYGSDSKTSVSTQRYGYEEKMNVRLKDDATLSDNSQIIVRGLKQPTVTEVKVDNGNIKLFIEKELGVEIVGDTKLKISVEDEEDEYEDLNEEEIDEIKEDYIK